MPATPPSNPETSPPPRPVVALDVDGVLNVGPGPGVVEHEVRVPAARVPDSPFIRGYGREELRTVVRVNPAHGAWITALRASADVVWATTWEHLANDYLAPLLGIDPLPVAVSAAAHPPRFGDVRGGDSIAWKAQTLSDSFRGRPLVWVDDQVGWAYTDLDGDRDDLGRLVHATPAEAGYVTPGYLDLDLDDLDGEDGPVDPWVRWVWRGADPTLVVCTDPGPGITVAQMAHVDRFVAHHAAGASPAARS